MRILICCVVLLAGKLLSAQQPWVYSEDVRYRKYQDPSLVVLQDGRALQVKFGVPGNLTFDEVEKWATNKPTVLAFNAENGPVLVEPESGKFISIIAGLEKHPIDLIVEKCLQNESTTRGMVNCYDRGHSLWDQEMNRLYAALMKFLSGVQKRNVQDAQQAWLKYRDSQITAIGAVITQGTISSISRADERMTLTKEQARRLERSWAQQ